MSFHPEIIDIFEKASFLKELTDPDIKQICSMVLTEYREKGNLCLSSLMEKAEREDLKKIIGENTIRKQPVRRTLKDP